MPVQSEKSGNREEKNKSNAYNKPKASNFLFRMPVIFAFKYLWVSSWMCICETNIHILILDLNLCVVCCYWNIHDDDVSGVLDAHFIGLLSLDYDNFSVCSVPNDGKWKIRNKKKIVYKFLVHTKIFCAHYAEFVIWFVAHLLSSTYICLFLFSCLLIVPQRFRFFSVTHQKCRFWHILLVLFWCCLVVLKHIPRV